MRRSVYHWMGSVPVAIVLAMIIMIPSMDPNVSQLTDWIYVVIDLVLRVTVCAGVYWMLYGVIAKTGSYILRSQKVLHGNRGRK